MGPHNLLSSAYTIMICMLFFPFVVERGDKTRHNSTNDSVFATNRPLSSEKADLLILDPEAKSISVLSGGSCGPGGVTTDLYVWLKADKDAYNTGTTNATDGQTVATWNDQSASNVDGTTDGNPPLFRDNSSNNINFNPTLDFDGTNDRLSLGNLANIKSGGSHNGYYTTLVVGIREDANANWVIGAISESGAQGFHFGYRSDNILTSAHGLSANANKGVPLYNSPAESPFMIYARYGPNAPFGDRQYLEHSRDNNREFGSNTTNSIIQGSLTNYVAHHNGNYYNGLISEVIIFDNTISDSDKNKIYSYLALKYGLMLKDLADASEDFLASDGSILWDASANSSYHNEVAGIGRDDASELNQKQSKSTDGNSDDIVTIGLGNIALTNSANSNSFTADKSFMIWGNDNGNTHTTSSDVPDGIFTRISRVWKVQETGTVGNTSVQFDLTGLGYGTDIDQFKLLVSGSATMANSTVVASANSLSGNILTFSDVDISNNQYFSLATSVAAPGGVSTDLYTWLKADSKAYHTGTTQATDGQTVTTWSNQAGHLTNGTESTNPPTYRNSSTNNINFNPALDFDGTNDLLELGNLDQIKSGATNTGDYTLLAVGIRQDGGANYVIGSQGGIANQDLVFGYRSNDTHLTLAHWGNDLNREVLTYNSPQQSPFLILGRYDGSGRLLEETRGGVLKNIVDSNTTDVQGSRISYIGSIPSIANYYNGLISEVIIYDNDISDTDKNKVYSYLALKYGITLSNTGGGIAGDYTASDGTTTFWDASAYSSYHHDVAGIGRDDTSSLNQKQSKSTRGNIVTMGLGSIATTNTANANSFTADKSFLLWGNNNADSLRSASNNSDIPSLTTERMSRIWRVNKTGTVGNVEIQFDLTGLGYDTHLNDFKLIVSGTTTMATGTVTASSSITDNVVSFSNVSLSDGDYFTIAIAAPLPAGVSSDNYVWLRADKEAYNTGTTNATDGQTVATWNDQSAANTDATSDGNPPLFKNNSTDNINFNPTLDFDGTDDRLTLGNLSNIKSGATNGGDYTLLAVGVRQDGGANYVIGSEGGTADEDLVFGYRSTDTQLTLAHWANDLDRGVLGYNNPQQSPFLILGRYDGSGRLLEETRDGVLKSITDSNTTDVQGSKTSYIGNISSLSQYYNGLISEVIVYDNDITDAEKNKIYSYLALKYGLTLSNAGGGSAGDYIASDGTTTYWDASANSSYHNDVAGIGRDASSQLIQKQSSSTSGNIVTIGLGSIATTNTANANSFTADKSFLLWGNDNASSLRSGANSSDLPSLVLERMTRVWKVQETGTMGNVEIRFDLTGLGYSNRMEDFGLIVSGSSTMAGGTITEPSSLSSNVVSFTGVDLTDGQFFTLATKRKSPGGINTDLTLWLKADDGTNTTTNGGSITSWNDLSGNAHNATGTGDAKYNTHWSNFNPALDFTGTVDPISGNVTRTNGTASTLFVVAEQTSSNSDNLLDFGTFTQSLTGAAYSHNLNDFNLTLNQKIIVSASDQGSTSGATVYENGNLIHTYASKARNTSWTSTPYTIGDNGPGFVANNTSLDGHIAEVIYFDQQLSAADQQKVEGYLGIKYGITLDNTAGGTAGDYLASDGSTIWDASTNSTYHHDVFAIGRDDLSELNQKQSKSANGDAIVSIGLGSIAADNASNTNSFTTNYSFTLIGNDNATANQAGANTADLPSDTRERMSRVWKVQEVGTIGNVEIQFDLTGLGYSTNLDDFQLIISNTTTMASGTVTSASSINSNVVSFTNIDLTDGQFFSLATKRQAPGAVSQDISLWLKADEGTNTTTQGSGITSWNDQSGEAQNASGTGDAVYNTNWASFNPAITFSQDEDPITGNITRSNGTASTVFMVGEHAGSSNVFYDFGNLEQNLSNGNYAHSSNNFSLAQNEKFIISASDQGSTSGAIVYQNGDELHTYASKARNTTWTTKTYTIGDTGPGFTGTALSLNGHIAELIYYDRQLSVSEQQKVESYLAIKYGITLGTDNDGDGMALESGTIEEGDYVNSSGTTLWDASANSSYQNDIAGIGRDDDSGLNQKQAKSVSSDGIVSIGLGNLAATNLANSNSFSADNSFMFWGNDNGATTQASANTSDLPAHMHERINRVWKVQETGTVGNVEIQFDLTGLGYGTIPDDFHLIISNTTTMASGTLTAASSINSNVVSFTGIDLTGGQFFSLATKTEAPGAVSQDLSLWLKADAGTNSTTQGAGITSWNDVSGEAQNATGTGNAVYNTTWASFNPAITFSQDEDPISGNITRSNGTASTVFMVGEHNGSSNVFYDFGSLEQNLSNGNYAHSANDFSLTQNEKFIVSASDQGGTSGAIVYQNGDELHTYASKARNTTWTTKTYTIGDSGPGFNGTALSLNGHVAEVIYYDRQLSVSEQQKVETYLALKYGISLGTDNDGDGTALESGTIEEGDYVNSSGTTLWDASANSSYQNDIAGIGRDDGSVLNQKQAKSVSSDGIVSVGLGSLASTNVANVNSFGADNSFMLWGNDNATTAQASANTADLPANILERIARVWKIQEVGTVGNVEIQFDLTGLGYGSNLDDFLLIISNSSTMASGTLTTASSIDGNVVSFTGIDLTDGQFFSLATKIEAPGAVSQDLSLWLKADEGTNTSTQGAGITSWNDLSGEAHNASGTGDAVYNTNWANFNPAISFTNNDDPISGSITRSNGTASTLFVAGDFTTITGNAFFTIQDEFTLWQRRYASNTNDYLISTNQPLIATVADVGGTGSAIVYKDGEELHTYTSKFQSTNWNSDTYILGDLGNANNDFRLEGHIAEVIFFDRQLSISEQQKIETYLALKYAISLGTDNDGDGTALESGTIEEGDYVSSAGTTLWDASVNSSYHNDITGIGRDDDSGLNQKQAKNANSDDIVSIGLGSVAATNAANSNSFSTDNSFILWGNDNAATAQASANTTDLPDDARERMSRVWKVEETGTVGNVEIQFDLTGLGYGTNLGQFQLIISNSSTMASGTLTTASSIDGNVVSFTGIDLTDGQFFSLATKTEAPGGITTDLYVWLKADEGTSTTTDNATLSTWTNQSAAGTNATSDGNPPLYKNNSTDNINFNPTLDFDGTNDRLVLGNLANIKSGAANGGDYTLLSVGKRQDNLYAYVLGSPGGTVHQELFFGYRHGGVNVTIDHNQNLLNLPTTTNFNPDSPFMLYAGYNGSGRILEETRGDNFGRTTDSNATDISGTKTNYVGHVDDVGVVGLEGYYNGLISEIIVYDNDITDLSKQQIYSYLAIKYGLSLTADSDNDATDNEIISGSTREGDYIASDGSTIVWTYSDNSTYHNDVAGIGRDDDSGLDQKQSKSTNTDAIVSMGLDDDTDGLETTNSANSNAFSTDRSFLLWGNDNADLNSGTAGESDFDPLQVNARLNREWKVQETGTIGTVLVQFDVSGLLGPDENIGTNDESQIVLLVDNDSDFTSGASLVSQSNVTNGDGLVNFRVDFSNGQYFTLASSEESALAVALISFEAKHQNNVIRLTWSTGSEEANSLFRIERSADGERFEAIGHVEGKNNSVGLQEYQFSDNNPIIGANYYRLIDIDLTGKENASEMIRVTFNPPLENSPPYPNPVKQGNNLIIPVIGQESVQLSVYHLSGKLRHPRWVDKGNYLSVETTSLQPGIYLIKTQTARGSQLHKVVVLDK